MYAPISEFDRLYAACLAEDTRINALLVRTDYAIRRDGMAPYTYGATARLLAILRNQRVAHPLDIALLRQVDPQTVADDLVLAAALLVDTDMRSALLAGDADPVRAYIGYAMAGHATRQSRKEALVAYDVCHAQASGVRKRIAALRAEADALEAGLV